MYIKLFSTRRTWIFRILFVRFTKFLLWVNLWYFGAWIRVAARAKCGRQTMRIQIRSHCYSNNIGDYIKTQGLISTKLWQGIVQNVFSLCAKLRVCPLFEISTIDQPLFRGWGPLVRGGIDQSHRYRCHQAACCEPAGSYATCFEYKTQYLLIRAPYTPIVVFWHISNIPPMISQSQINCNCPTFYIEAIFVKYCYTTDSWLL